MGKLETLEHLLARFERVALDLVSAITPWLAPTLSAWIAFENLSEVLRLPLPVAITGALVVEFLGLSTVHTTFQFWSWNSARRAVITGHSAADMRAPTLVAAAAGGFYLAIVITTNVMLEVGSVPLVHIVAKALLTLSTVVAGVILAIRQRHARLLMALTEARTQAAEARRERKVAGKLPDHSGNTRQVAYTTLTSDWRNLGEAERAALAGLSAAQIAARHGISERAARLWRKRLETETVEQPATSLNGVAH